ISIVQRSPTTARVRATEQFKSLTESHRIGACHSLPKLNLARRNLPQLRGSTKTSLHFETWFASRHFSKIQLVLFGNDWLEFCGRSSKCNRRNADSIVA